MAGRRRRGEGRREDKRRWHLPPPPQCRAAPGRDGRCERALTSPPPRHEPSQRPRPRPVRSPPGGRRPHPVLPRGVRGWRRLDPPVGGIQAQTRLRPLRPHCREVLRRRREGQRDPDEPGRPVLRPVLPLRALQQPRQDAGGAVHGEARAEHRLRRRLREALPGQPEPGGHARRLRVQHHVWWVSPHPPQPPQGGLNPIPDPPLTCPLPPPGPDICGPGTKKVHVIFNYKGKNVLINKDIRCKDDEFSHLYTLVVRPDNTYEVKIDNARVESGSLEEDWDFLPPKKIKDPEAKKPDDWDERAKIDDPEDTKPEDWDKPEHIPDPDAKKPEDWDEEMDGEWEPPVIQNPEYKGEWRPQQIDNPDYKGKWVHPEIDNPEYSPDPLLYSYDSFGVIGLDLWQVKSGTIFDNFLITDDEKLAEEIGNETWGATKDAERKMKEQQDEEQRKKQEEEEKQQKEEEGDDEGDGDEEEEDEEEPEAEPEEAEAAPRDEL